MDQERERIQADLRGLVAGEVRCDDIFLQLYASDASLYEVRPLGVVRPRNTADVVACVQYAAENSLPIHARGAGTGLAGESLGPGLILDFSHSMRRVLEFNDESVRIQPGLVHAHLNQQLAARGRIFGPDPATSIVTTMGSVLALDGAGSHHRKYGSARDHIERLQVVLADGSVIEAGTHDFAASGESDDLESLDDVSIDADSRRAKITRRIGNLLTKNASLIEQHRPRTEVARSGYRLDGIVADGKLKLARLLAGSEGTLALITEATVRTQPLPRYKGIALLFFDRLESAAKGAMEVRRLGADTCDLMDRRMLTLAQESDIHYDLLLPKDAEAMLMVEQSGESRETVYKSIQQIVDRLRRRKRLAFDARTAFEDDDIALFERLPRQVIPRLYRLKGSSRAVPFVEDIAVPPETLPDFLVRVQNVLKSRQITAALFCHAMHGQLHLRPFLDIARQDDVDAVQPLAEDLYRETLDAGGTISGEHGDGLSRTWFVERQSGPLYPLMREVKRIFDPQNILNPGKVISEAPQAVHDRLRKVSAANPPPENGTAAETAPAPLIELQLNWDMDQVALAARNCNGCGRCRTTLDDTRMCPLFRLSPAEEASPRAKANLARGLLTGALAPDNLGRDELKEVADLCFNCHQCRLECPASVDIPKLVAEAKGQYVAQNGLRLNDRFFARLDRVVAWGSSFRSVSNWAIGSRFARWLLERTFGVAQGRKLPRFAANTFLREAHRRRVTRETRRTGRKVVYFVDTYANWFDPDLGEAMLDCLAHNGVSVYVPPDQLASGMQLVQLGALERLRSIARRNITLLADTVRQGYEIVCSEPSAALCLKEEYPKLVDHEDAALVAEHTHEACAYLWRMHQQGQLELDLRPVNATLGYHQPCHSRALDPGSPGEHLLRLIPGLTVKRLERGCSGMAGVYGLKRENYRSSLRIGWGLISAMRQPQIQAGVSECSACKMQMEQGVTKPTVHPLKMLALAYGLRPDFAALLSPSGEELVIT